MTTTRNPFRVNQKTAIAALATIATLGLTGCHTSSKASLGFRPNDVVQDEYAVTDSIGAAMFGRHVRLAHAQANSRRLQADSFATVPLIED